MGWLVCCRRCIRRACWVSQRALNPTYTTIACFVGASVIKVVTRIMGMIIMAIAVGMLADGLVGLLPALH